MDDGQSVRRQTPPGGPIPRVLFTSITPIMSAWEQAQVVPQAVPGWLMPTDQQIADVFKALAVLEEDRRRLATQGDPRYSTEAALKPENQSKNRYVNVLPYDATRVIVDGDSSGRYLNANLVKEPSWTINSPGKMWITTQVCTCLQSNTCRTSDD
jgi:Protein-tyrosine phosphatase